MPEELRTHGPVPHECERPGLDLAALLGRPRIDTDVERNAGYLYGARVLVTGAGGFIGSELCRQISRWGPAAVMMLDRDETRLHIAMSSVRSAFPDADPEFVLADVRDAKALVQVFRDRRPDVVFHAAALKWLPMLEQFPGEAVKTNVFGTHSVLQAGIAAGVDCFVNVSTDKAADPVSALGYSKRLAEGLTSAAATASGRSFVSVRFGNVLGCQGSFTDVFHRQIAAGQPVTVTHPRATRYLMMVQEAAELVVQAGAIGRPGRALVLDMGDQVRILDVARRIMAQTGTESMVSYIGLRPGEKLTETLFGLHEADVERVHPHIMQIRVPAADAGACLGIDAWAGSRKVLDAMRAMCAVMSPGAADRRHPASLGE